jgi:hypothetical protein
MGAYGVVLETSRLAQPGDTLILALEPPLLGSSLDFTQDALQVLIRRMDWEHVAQAKQVTGRAVPLDHLFFAPRPGLDNFAAFLGRTVTQTPFRYTTARIKPGGLMVTDFRYQSSGSGYTPVISPTGRELLVHLHEWASEQKMRLVYSIPWMHIAQERADEQKRLNAHFVVMMSEIMPVVHEEEFGVQTDAFLFSDSGWHLTEEAAQLRTSQLVSRVQADDFWTADQLAQAKSGLR